MDYKKGLTNPIEKYDYTKFTMDFWKDFFDVAKLGKIESYSLVVDYAREIGEEPNIPIVAIIAKKRSLKHPMGDAHTYYFTRTGVYRGYYKNGRLKEVSDMWIDVLAGTFKDTYLNDFPNLKKQTSKTVEI